MRNKAIIWGALLIVVLGCNGILEVRPPGPELKTEIEPGTEVEAPAGEAPAQDVAEGGEAAPTEALPPTATPVPTSTPPPTETPVPTATPYFLQQASMDSGSERSLPRHGLLIALVLPLFVLGIPWVIAELFVVRYVQPRSIDLSQVRVKAQDGLFIEAAISLTARRSLTLASTRMTWPRVREFVEKTLEQELIHEALNFPTLDELERNIKGVAEGFNNLQIVHELSHDFGVEVMRFNVETRYPQETMDALNRKAEASAGGTAYLAYAYAAHLDPETREARELYRVYQETRGQVDAARNLGGGLTTIASMFQQQKLDSGESNNGDDSKQ